MKIIVTDLTRFTNREIVCLAGIDPVSGRCIRPMWMNGNKSEYLSFSGVKQHKVIPGSILEAEFTPVNNPHPPHIEDCIIEGKITNTGNASADQFEDVLRRSAFTSVAEAFGAPPDGKSYSTEKPPQKSIITLRIDSPARQFKIIVDDKYGKPKFKAHITDGDGRQLSFLSVTDLGFVDHITQLITKDPTLAELNKFLANQDHLYLRIGLSRPWSKDGEAEKLWVQLNGIYSFPNFREDLRVYD